MTVLTRPFHDGARRRRAGPSAQRPARL